MTVMSFQALHRLQVIAKMKSLESKPQDQDSGVKGVPIQESWDRSGKGSALGHSGCLIHPCGWRGDFAELGSSWG